MALAGQLGVTRLGVSPEKLAPDVKRLNPLEKIRNLPSQNFASLFQAIVFLPLLALAVCAVVGQNLAAYAGLVRDGLGPALVVVGASLKNFLWKSRVPVSGDRLPRLHPRDTAAQQVAANDQAGSARRIQRDRRRSADQGTACGASSATWRAAT